MTLIVCIESILTKKKLLSDYKVTFCIPKMHAYAHGVSCRMYIHPTFVSGTGNTDGEASERGWSHLGRVSTITKT